MRPNPAVYPPDPLCDIRADKPFMEIHDRVQPYTMTTIEAQYALWRAVKYAVKAGIPGDFVECGVWKGGSAMLVALALKYLRRSSVLWLYDTFQGMTPPGEEDGIRAQRWDSAYLKTPLDDVERNMRMTGHSDAKIRYVVGDVCKTLKQPENLPERIAILRLDTDFYASTKAELHHLYPLLSPGGVLIIDDYFAWEGCRKAVDYYFGEATLLNRVDYSVRLVVKR